MSVVSMRELLEAGVHFGHQTRRWNPKMRRFIFTERGGIYIIDLQQTQQLLEEAYEFAKNIAARNGTVLFVGTKKQAQDAVENHAKRVGMPYVNHRWLGGLLTNWRTIHSRIDRLHELRRLQAEGQLELLPSKERIELLGQLEKLDANLGGVADMKRHPDAVFILDLKKEQLGVAEARRLNLPVIALVDTNCDPDEADLVIPGNDDAIRSCELVARVIADGIEAGRAGITEKEISPRAGDRRRAGRRGGARGGAGDRAGGGRRAGVAEGGARRRRGDHVTAISATLVKELREMTGAGIMDAKRALQDTGGDVDAAKKLLREKGMANADKRAGRVTTEGKVGYRIHEDGSRATIVGIGCETEPVSNNDAFMAFAKKVLDLIDDEGVGAEAKLEEERKELTAKLGENIQIVSPARFERIDTGTLEGYAHPPANKLGVLVQLRGGSPELARKVAMHIAASAPQYIAREDVPEELVTAERDILLASDEVLSKPEQAREKIVEGMINKRFFAAQVLAEQPWIHDTAKTVGQALEDEGAQVAEFERISLSG